MRKLNVFVGAVIVAALSAVPASGHQGEMKFMFQFPDHLVPTLDGDMSDWDIVSEVYQIQGETMFNQFGAQWI